MRLANSVKLKLYILLVTCSFSLSKAEKTYAQTWCKLPVPFVQLDISSACQRIHNRLERNITQIMAKLDHINNNALPQSPQPQPQPQSQPLLSSPPPPSPLSPTPSLSTSSPVPRDCSDLPCGSGSGVYEITPSWGKLTPAFCDMIYNGGGWTVIQRRADILPRQDFFKHWNDYKWGFGSLTGEFWWGLENMWAMTSQPDRKYRLRIDMEDFEDQWRSAEYDGFTISSEADGYRIKIANFSGSVESDFGDSFTFHSGSKFSTVDKDQDSVVNYNCAKSYKGGWWYRDCVRACLNGQYFAGHHNTGAATGINWKQWRGYSYSLKSVEMKIRKM